jgi:hypothetical protein
MSEQQQPKEYIITDEQLLIVEHGCIYPDKDGCIGNRCKYHDPNPSFRDNVVCLLNERDIANGVRSRPHPAPALDELKRDLEFKQACIENQAMHINTLNAKMAEMMQGASRKAREDATLAANEKFCEMLDDIQRDLGEAAQLDFNEDLQVDYRGVVSTLNDVKRVLRSTTPQTEQEQPR